MHTMYKMPKCTCGEELKFDSYLDLWSDGDVAIMINVGYCPKCNKKYRWQDHFVLSHWDKLKEETE